jgi:hypothetical protein
MEGIQSLYFDYHQVTMFLPDLFSNSSVTYSKPIKNKIYEIKDVLESFYTNLGKQTGEIYQCGSLEINSNNYKVEIGNNKYVLKRILGNKKDIKIKQSQVELLNWLADNNIPAPTVLESTHEDQYIIENENNYWCLMKYMPGCYYSGKDEEFSKTSEVLIKLFSLLKTYPINNGDFGSNDLPARKSIVSVEQVYKRKHEWSDILGEDNARYLNSSWDKFNSDLNLVIEKRDDLLTNVGLCHIDMHPHNVLINNTSVSAILDFESFLIAPTESVILFNLFKLARQSIVFDLNVMHNNSINMILQSVLNELKKQDLIRDLDKNDVVIMAKVEVIRRILIILDLSFYNNVSTWNHVLSIQLNALYEIDALFNDI